MTLFMRSIPEKLNSCHITMNIMLGEPLSLQSTTKASVLLPQAIPQKNQYVEDPDSAGRNELEVYFYFLLPLTGSTYTALDCIRGFFLHKGTNSTLLQGRRTKRNNIPTTSSPPQKKNLSTATAEPKRGSKF